MKTKSKNYVRKALSLWVICFFAFLAFYLFFIRPQRKLVQRFDKNLTETKKLYEKALASSRKKNQEIYQKQIQKLEKKLNAFVVGSDDTANLTLDISEIASRKNISSFSIRGEDRLADKSSKIPGCRKITENFIRITFSADFADFAAFLNAMERHSPVVFVDGFEISRSNRKDAEPEAEMELAIFVKKQSQDA